MKIDGEYVAVFRRLNNEPHFILVRRIRWKSGSAIRQTEARDWLPGGRQSWTPRLLVEICGRIKLGHKIFASSALRSSANATLQLTVICCFSLRTLPDGKVQRSDSWIWISLSDSQCAVTRCHVAKFWMVDALDLLLSCRAAPKRKGKTLSAKVD